MENTEPNGREMCDVVRFICRECGRSRSWLRFHQALKRDPLCGACDEHFKALNKRMEGK